MEEPIFNDGDIVMNARDYEVGEVEGRTADIERGEELLIRHLNGDLAAVSFDQVTHATPEQVADYEKRKGAK